VFIAVTEGNDMLRGRKSRLKSCFFTIAATSINETFGIYNYSGITKPIARPFLESHFQSLVACRTPYLTGISITHLSNKYCITSNKALILRELSHNYTEYRIERLYR